MRDYRACVQFLCTYFICCLLFVYAGVPKTEPYFFKKSRGITRRIKTQGYSRMTKERITDKDIHYYVITKVVSY